MKKLLFILIYFMAALCGFAQREVCGVAFGSSYNTTKNALQNKFGFCDNSDKNEIVYYNKSYSGVFFSRIMFE